MDRDQASTSKHAPSEWITALDQARAEIAAGHVVTIDIDELCSEIEAEADRLDGQVKSVT